MKMFRVLAAAVAILGSAAAAAAADAPAGALACSGCHPAAQGIAAAVPRLVGRNAGEIAAAMTEFRSGQRPGTVMGRIAKGFGDDEIQAIAGWYAAQKD
jgi:cytochrome c553